MFQTKSKNDELLAGGGASTTIIAAGTTFKGNIECKGDIRIDGTLVGDILSKAKVVIGAQGTVEGDVEGHQADIMGLVVGNIQVRELLQLKGQSRVQGNLSVGKLQIEMNATFNGQCFMHSNKDAQGVNEEALLPS